MPDVLDKLRTCTSCFRVLPVTDFRRRKKGTEIRNSVCHVCHSGEQRLRRKVRRERCIGEYAKAVIDAQRGRNKVVALTNELFRQFGDVENIVRNWDEAYQAAKKAGRHLCVSKLLLAPLDLYIMTLQLEREQQKDLENLRDEDLEHLREQQLEALRIQLTQRNKSESSQDATEAPS